MNSYQQQLANPETPAQKPYLSQTDEEEWVWKIQVKAQQFYNNIWQSLNAKEKYILFDLAEDGLVNLHDGYTLRILMKKGLIVRDDESWQLRLFNKSFRNFILTFISGREAEKIQKQIKEGWQWSHLKTPLLLVVLAVLAFLMISQHQAFARVFGYLSAMAAIIPVVSTLAGMFKREK